MELIVQGITCPKCKDFIYSRARHDWHTCTCKAIFVDGGFDYVRYGSLKDEKDFAKIKISDLVLKDVTKVDLYKDWNEGRDQYGVLVMVKRPGDKKAQYTAHKKPKKRK